MIPCRWCRCDRLPAGPDVLVAIHGGLNTDIKRDHSERKHRQKVSGQHEADKSNCRRHDTDGNRESSPSAVNQVARERRSLRRNARVDQKTPNAAASASENSLREIGR